MGGGWGGGPPNSTFPDNPGPGAEAVLQVVEVRCMEPPAVLHVTFVSEVDDVASAQAWTVGRKGHFLLT